MASVNKVILIGNLGADPDSRYMPNGDAVANITMATTEKWTDKSSGQKQEKTEWHRVVFYGRLAEVVSEYLRKGRPVYVEGRLSTRKYTDNKAGVDRYITEIIARDMVMLGAGQASGEAAPASADRRPESRRKNSSADSEMDDIPF